MSSIAARLILLSAFLLVVVQSRGCCKYFNPDKVMNIKADPEKPTAKIPCYDRISWWVCADLYDDAAVKEFDRLYSMGIMVGKKVVTVPRSFVYEKANCNDWRGDSSRAKDDPRTCAQWAAVWKARENGDWSDLSNI